MTAYNGAMPTFSVGEDVGVAAKLNQIRDLGRAFTDAWSAYTPTLTASTTNPTGWTQTGYYMQAGKLVIARFYVAAGGSMTAGSGTYRVALPVAANMTAQQQPGNVLAWDTSAGNAAQALALISASTYAQLLLPGTAGFVSHAVPWTWASGDYLNGTLIYEAA